MKKKLITFAMAIAFLLGSNMTAYAAENQLGFSFQVAYEETEEPTVVYNEVTQMGEANYVKEVIEIIEEKAPLAAVETGESEIIDLALVVLMTSIVMVILTLTKKKKVEDES